MKEPVFNPFDRSTRSVAVTSIVRMSILGALKNHKTGMVSREIVSTVRCRREAVLAALRVLWESGEITASPRQGRGGGVVWRIA